MKNTWITTLLFAALICAAISVSRASSQPGHQSAREDENSESRIGLAISPVKLNLQNKDVHMVGLGSYIVNAQSACADCHSCPTYAVGHNPYLGQPKQFNAENYLAGGVPFGPISSPNLTPDANGKPAGLGEGKFIHTIRSGQDPDGSGRLLQVMPWPTFQSMTDHDLRAIYAYLTAIPPAQPGSCSGPGE